VETAAKPLSIRVPELRMTGAVQTILGLVLYPAVSNVAGNLAPIANLAETATINLDTVCRAVMYAVE